jgi:hypothetical protein
MEAIKALLENEQDLLRYFLCAVGALVVIAVFNQISMYLGKKIKVLNNLAGMASTLMMPIGLVTMLLGLLTGCAYAGLPWFISGLACAFIFIIGVGYMWSRSR